MKHLAIVTLLTLVAATAAAGQTSFTATLNGDNNVPPIPEVTATGTGMFTLNATQTELTFHIEYAGLSSPEIASHIHIGNPRENGSVAFPLPTGTPKDGVWEISPEDVAHLLAGELYVNVHTETYVAGEIRGNLEPAAVSTREISWGQLKSMYTLF
jgi:hypothetical protein